MRAPQTRAVMGALGAGKALFVGGCVRNTMLEVLVEDIDIATVHTPDRVMDLLTKKNIKTIPTGFGHGTVTAAIGENKFEITTLRSDIKTDGRHAIVKFSDSWAADAQRRDFTINTLLADMDGNIFDPTGQGVDDLQNRRVAFVGDPAQRIVEDVLRILRFFRFHAYYGPDGGRGEPDGSALKACREAAHLIPNLSKERITQEFFKILSVEQPANILAVMAQSGVLLPVILKGFLVRRSLGEGGSPEGSNGGKKDPSAQALQDDILGALRRLCNVQKQYGLAALSPRLFALADFDCDNIAVMEETLLLPKAIKKDIEGIDKVLKMQALGGDKSVKVAVYKHGRMAVSQALMIELAQGRVSNDDAPAALDIIQNWDIPIFPISGEDLIREGFTPGPALGRELERREEAWIDSGFVYP